MKDYSIQTGSAMPEADASPVQTTGTFANLQLACIVPGLYNPRTTFDEAALAELAASIKAQGVNQPILVRPLPASRVADTKRTVTHEIIAGERRYRAGVLAGVATIPALIKPMTDTQALEFQLIENLQREDLNAMEEAEGYAHYCQATGTPKEDIGAKFGRSRTHVYNRLKLLELCQAGKEALRTGQIDPSVAERIARVPDSQLQAKALAEATRVDYQDKPVHSARTFAKWMQENLMLNLSSAVFKMTDASLLPDAGSCKTCHKRTGHAPDLFSDVKGADVCTDPPCFHKKEEAHNAQLLHHAHERGQTVIQGREAKALMPYSGSAIDGYLRLDNKYGSPTDQPLRKLLGKHLAASGIQPTVIVNPHKAGELIEVLSAEVVADMLKAAGHTTEAKAVTKDKKRDDGIDKAREEAKLKGLYEHGWRDMVMQRAWQSINSKEAPSIPPDHTVLRIIAQRYLAGMNKDRATVLCKLLGLGKVAPQQALADHVNSTAHPVMIVLLLIMHADVAYTWLDNTPDQNVGLLQVAKDQRINIEAIKSEAKQKFMPEPVVDAAKPTLKGPAALRKDQLDAAAKKSKPAKPARAKMTAQEAQLGIAEAMQKDEAASPKKIVPFGAGQSVRVTTDPRIIKAGHEKWLGKVGLVRSTNPLHAVAGVCDVMFHNDKNQVFRFLRSQLELCDDQAEVA